MKKLVAVLCAAVMTVGMAVNVFAAPSPVISGAVEKVTAATDANGNAAEVIIQTLTEAEQDFTAEEKTAVDELKADPAAVAKEVLGDEYDTDLQLVDIRNLIVKGDVQFPLTLTLKITGVTKDSNVKVLHFNKDTNGWEKVPVTVNEDGTITFTVDSLSPFAFFVDGTTAKNVGSATSPATGESNAMVWVAIVAVAAAAGMVVTYRRKRA